MNITIQTIYDKKALCAMAEALRKTVQKKNSSRNRLTGWAIAVIGLAMTLIPGENGIVVTGKTVLMWVVMAAVIVTMFFEDRINGYFAGKQALPGTEVTTTVFGEEGYTIANGAGETSLKYENIQMVVEMEEFFVFILDANHGQAYQKETITGGTVDELRTFLEKKLGKPVEKI